MEIRPANDGDIRALAELWAEAFPGERTVGQRVRQLQAGGVYGGIDTAFIATDDQGTVGGFRAYKLEQYMYGRVFPMMGLAAVAVVPRARRQGLGAELCRFALRHAKERGDVFSVLYPFRPSFYEALGWGLVGSLNAYEFAPHALRVTHAKPRVSLVKNAVDTIGEAYDIVASRSNGMIKRTPRIWRQHLDWPDVHTFALSRDGVCAGYVIVHNAAALHPEERTLTIRELIAVDDNAYDELLSWISFQGDFWYRVVYNCSPCERFDMRIPDATIQCISHRPLHWPFAHQLRGPMVRIVDVGAALMSTKWIGGGSFKITVRDDALPDNSDTFYVESSNGTPVVSSQEPHHVDLSLVTSVSVLAQLLLGDITVLDAVRMGLAQTSANSARWELFGGTGTFQILDEF